MSPSFTILLFFAGAVSCTAQMTATYEQYKVEEYASPQERQGALIRKLRSYDIDYPTVTDRDSSHMGYLTDASSRRRRKRAINLVEEHDPFHYQFRSNGENYTMELRMNTELFGPDFQVENFYEDDRVEKKKMEEHCYLIGRTIPQDHKVAVSDCDGLLGAVATDRDVLYIEPLLNDSYVEKEKLKGPGRPHLIYRESELAKLDETFDPMGIKGLGRIAPAYSRRRAPVQLSYITFINRSGRIIKLMWLDSRNTKMFFATMMPGTSRKVNTFTSHKWYALDDKTGQYLLIGNKKEYAPTKNRARDRRSVYIRIPKGVHLDPVSDDDIKKAIGKKYIEAMTVADKSVLDFHGKDKAARYIMALMNIVSYVFTDKSLGIDIKYVLVRIVLLHKDPKEVTLTPSNPNGSLMSVCSYMNKIRTGRTDADPKYHDHATFLTRRGFGGAAGYAPVHAMCHPVKSCTLNGEDGFPSAFIIAHEVGHSLGMEHDGEGNRCKSVTSHGSVMAPLVQSRMGRFLWSSCSRKELLGSIRNFGCLNDKPGDQFKKDLPYLHRHPGVHYSTDDQCHFDFGAGYKFCKAFYKDPCVLLWCNMPNPYQNFCKSMRAPALNGTECGEKKWCINRRCVPRTEEIAQPDPIDGGWSNWSAWEKCSKECGVGLHSRRRTCTNPAPRYRGKDCVGSKTEEKLCNIEPCQHTVPLHDDAVKSHCSAIGKKKDYYRKWTYYDETKVNLDCTFENNLCSWVNLRRDDQMDWIRRSGATPTTRTGPSVDHTTNSSAGRYIYFEASVPAKRGHRASLSSPDLGVRVGCLSFWYHMFGDETIGTLRVVRLNKMGSKTLWSKKKNEGDRWLQAHVNIREDSLYNLVFQAERAQSYRSDIALDDISFVAEPCEGVHPKDQDAPNPCVVSCVANGSRKKIIMNNPVLTGLRCYDNNSLDICIDGKCRNVGCDGVLDSRKEFDSCGVCGGDGSTCRKEAGKLTTNLKKDREMSLNIPRGSSNIYVKKSQNDGHMFVMSVNDPLKPNRLRYVINGNDKESRPAIYSVSGTQYVYTKKYGKETIRSLGVVNDDLAINLKKQRRGSPSSPVEVQYEYFTKERSIARGTIGEPTTVQLGYRWVILDEWTPCSSSCGKGWSHLRFFCKIGDRIVGRSKCKHLKLEVKQKVKICNIQPCETYEWKKSPWSACSKSCSQGSMTRKVTCTGRSGNQPVEPRLCKRQKPKETKSCFVRPCAPEWTTGDWSNCSVVCGVGHQTRDVFCADENGERTSGCSEHTQPKSRKSCMKPACPSGPEGPLDCDFERNLCNWKQLGDDDFDWSRHRGKTKSADTGPPHDHTRGNKKGYYLYTEASSPQRVGYKARLISPEVNARRACLTFFYHMLGWDIGELGVRLRTKSGYTRDVLWHKKGNQANRWMKAKVNIEASLSDQIVIEATRGRGYRGDIAIDDIVFHRNACHKKVKNYAGKRNDLTVKRT